jgi:hypothetical protein
MQYRRFAHKATEKASKALKYEQEDRSVAKQRRMKPLFVKTQNTCVGSSHSSIGCWTVAMTAQKCYWIQLPLKSGFEKSLSRS